VKRIRINKYKDYPFEFVRLNKIVPYNYRFLYAKPLFVLFIILFLIASIISLNFLPYFLSLLSVYAYTLFVVRKQSQSIVIKRTYNKKTKEERNKSFRYRIENPYAFDLQNVILIDSINAFIDKRGKSEFYRYLGDARPNSVTHENITLEMNTGMGKKEMGPFVVIATDILGIHRCTFIDDSQVSIKVIPKVYPTG
jgi:hypothetical protein